MIAKEGLVRGLQKKETGERIAKEGKETGEMIAKEGLMRGLQRKDW